MVICRWQSAVTDFKCTREAFPGSGYCLLHEPGKKDIKALQELIDTDAEHLGLQDGILLIGGCFPCTVHVGSHPHLDSKGTTISCSNRVVRLVLNEATIEGDLDIIDLDFSGSISLRSCEIQGNLRVKESAVRDIDARELRCGNLRFHGLKCSNLDLGGATATLAELEEVAVIGFVDVRKGLAQSVQIERTAAEFLHLDELCARMNVHLHRVSITRLLSACALSTTSLGLHEVEVGEGLDLGQASVAALNLERVTVSEWMSIAELQCSELFNMAGTAVAHTLTMQHVEISGSATVFLSSAGHLNLGDGRPSTNPLRRQRKGVRICRSDAATQVWAFVRQSLEREARRDAADAAHYFERVARITPWRALQAKGGGWKKAIRRVMSFVVLLPAWIADLVLLRWSSAYGSSLPRLAGTWVTLVGGFALLYVGLTSWWASLPLFADSAGRSLGALSFPRALYFSIVTFTTLGFGDIVPQPGLGSALVAAEAILGGITMALTVMVVGRKFMR